MRLKNDRSRALGDIWNGRKRVPKLAVKELDVNGAPITADEHNVLQIDELAVGGQPVTPFTLREGTPQNAVQATATLTITDTVDWGESVTIGADVYEFVESGKEPVIEGAIAVVILTGDTAENAGNALVTASAGGTEPVTLTSTVAGTVVVTVDVAGVAGNGIEVDAENLVNGTFSAVATENGKDGTVGKKFETYFDGTDLYIATADNTIVDANWKSMALTLT
jgi:hypothetical protein